MSDISPQWSLVISELRNDTESRFKDDRDLLQDATLDVAARELHQLESQSTRDSPGWRALQKVKPLLSVLDGFAEFAGTLASLDPHGIASIVIGSFRILIKFASGFASTFEKISSSFEPIHDKLGRLIAHENRFKAKPSKRLNNALYKVFKAYWAFFEDVYSLFYSEKHHKSKGFRAHFTDYISGHVAEVESHINGFQELCDTANEEIQLASEQRRDDENATLQEGIEKILAEMSTLEKENFRRECREFKRWVEPVDMNEKMKRELKKRIPGTGSWIFENSSFLSWLDGGSSNEVKTRSVLWLTAGPGFGKSSLAAFLANHLRRTATTGVAYFSVDTTSNETETSIVPALLRTVLDQLFAPNPITKEPHFEIRPSTIQSTGDFRSDIGYYLTVLKETLREQSKPTTIIIDALDQCPNNGTTQYQLEELLSTVTGLPPSCKILLTSRPHPWFEDTIGDVMAKLPCPKFLTKEDITRDISSYVHLALDRITEDNMCGWEDNFRDKLEDQIIKNSEGMFKWTELVIKDLSTLEAKKKMDIARKTLDGVPRDLKEIYQKALNNIARIEDGEEKRQVSRILQWILRNYRPLRMKELSAALAIGAEYPLIDLRDLLDRHLSDLVYVDFETEIITMTHHTATEFLTASPRYKCKDGYQAIPDQLAEIDLDILLACLSFWSDSDRQFLDAFPVGRETEERFEEVLLGYDAMGYSCIGLIHHLIQVAEAQLFPEELESALGDFFRLDEHQNLLRWLQMFCYLRFKNRRGANEAYSAVFEALRDTDAAARRPLQRLLNDKYPDIKGHLGYSDGGRFLRWQQILESLIPPCFNATLLASFFNFRGALDSLAKEGETLHYGRVYRPNALVWAAYGDATDSLALLLGKEYIDNFPSFREPYNWDPHDWDRKNPSPLVEAVFVRENMESRPGTYPTAIMLLDHGCHISAGFEIVLLSSVPDSSGARELAERVLKIPNAFTFKEDSLGGIINYAVFTGQSQILEAFTKDKRLLENLAALNPLLKNRVAQMKKPDLPESLDLFVPMLATVSGRLERYIDAIHLAGLNNDSRSIRVLCASEVYARLIANYVGAHLHGWTPLHCAAQRGLEVLRHKKGRHNEWVTTVTTIQAGDHGVNALLEFSADADPADIAGNLPIHLAAYRGCEASVSRLSQCHNEWDRPNDEGKTPLAIALQLHHLEVANILIHNGASLDKVSDGLRRQFNIIRGDASNEVKVEAQWPKWLFYAACIRSYTRKRGRPEFPLPIVARILRECEIFEVFEVERHDGYSFDERIPKILYLQSPPVIPSSNSRPIERLVIEARSGLGEWSSLNAEKVEGSTGSVVPWLDRRLFHRKPREPVDDSATFSPDNNDRRYLRSLRPGDRVALVPLGIYPAWTVQMEHARIRLVMSGIRDCFSNQDRERIWKPRKSVPNETQLRFFKNYGKDAKDHVGVPFRHVDDRGCTSHSTKLPLRPLRKL